MSVTSRLGRLRRGFTLLVVVGLLAASPAWAAPAVVKVFEAAARKAPSLDAAVVHVFPEKAEISVSEEVTDGWRRVHCPDGTICYVRDAEVALVNAEKPDAPPAAIPEASNDGEEYVKPLPHATPPPRARPSSPRATIYVKDLDHLAELVESDNVVHPKAESLATRHKAEYGLLIGGGLVGSGLMLASLTVLATKSCGVGNYSDICATEFNKTGTYAGIAIVSVSALVALLIAPTRSDLLDVINEWNERHRDQPFTLDRSPGRSED